jgi:uncharacterized protein
MDKKLRILAAADLHGDVGVAEQLARKALDERVDLVVLAGDVYGYAQSGGGILRPFREMGQKVLFVPGNCDFDEDVEDLGEVGKNLDGYYVTYGGVGIVGIGSRNWKLAHDSDDFVRLGELFARMGSGKRVLVSHLHAEGTRAEDFGFEGWSGDFVLRAAVEMLQPDVLISGHVHEAEGIRDRIGKTEVIQVGKGGEVIEL